MVNPEINLNNGCEDAPLPEPEIKKPGVLADYREMVYKTEKRGCDPEYAALQEFLGEEIENNAKDLANGIVAKLENRCGS